MVTGVIVNTDVSQLFIPAGILYSEELPQVVACVLTGCMSVFQPKNSRLIRCVSIASKRKRSWVQSNGLSNGFFEPPGGSRARSRAPGVQTQGVAQKAAPSSRPRGYELASPKLPDPLPRRPVHRALGHRKERRVARSLGRAMRAG